MTNVVCLAANRLTFFFFLAELLINRHWLLLVCFNPASPNTLRCTGSSSGRILKSFYLAVWLVIGTISNQLTTLPSN